MEFAKEEWLLLISSPLYILVIGGEIIVSQIKKNHLYSLKGFFTNFILTSLNFMLDAGMKLIGTWALLGFFYHLGGIQMERVISPVFYWILLTLSEDFMFYLEHCVDHYCRLFWAVHVTHHSSQEYNLSVGFRSSVFQPLYRFIYFIPLAVAGFKPEDIMFTYAWTQIWGVLVHTQTIGKLWWPIELIFTTPSHHRVHHASNVNYLDKNMGMFLIIWDRIFGTFESEKPQTDPVKYGLTQNLENPTLWQVITHEFKSIIVDMRKSDRFSDKMRYLLGPPGWSHDGSKRTSKQLRAHFKHRKD